MVVWWARISRPSLFFMCSSLLFLFRSFPFFSVLFRSFGRPKRTKRPRRRENRRGRLDGSGRGHGNSPFGLRQPVAFPALPPSPPPDFHNGAAIRMDSARKPDLLLSYLLLSYLLLSYLLLSYSLYYSTLCHLFLLGLLFLFDTHSSYSSYSSHFSHITHSSHYFLPFLWGSYCFFIVLVGGVV